MTAASFSTPAPAIAQLIDRVRDWTDVTLVPHPDDAVAVRLGDTTIGILQKGGQLEVPMPQPIRTVLIEEDFAVVANSRSDPDWVAAPVEKAGDVEAAALLLRLSYLYRRVLRSSDHVAFRHIRVELAHYDLPETLTVIYETMLTKRADPPMFPQ